MSADDDALENAVRALIRGRVQGVGYRAWLAGAARQIGARGWVRNRRDGAVEAQIEGPPATIDALLEACARGPAFARVDQVESAPSAPENPEDFRIAPTR